MKQVIYLLLLILLPCVFSDLEITSMPVISSNNLTAIINPYYTNYTLDLGFLSLSVQAAATGNVTVPIQITGFFAIGHYDLTDQGKVAFLVIMIVLWISLIFMSNVLHIPHLAILQFIIGVFLGVVLSAIHIILLISVWALSIVLAISSYKH